MCDFHNKIDINVILPKSLQDIKYTDINWFTFNRSLGTRQLFPGWCSGCGNRDLPMDVATTFSVINSNIGKIFETLPYWVCNEECNIKLVSKFYYDGRFLEKDDERKYPCLYHRKIVPDENINETASELCNLADLSALSRDLYFHNLEKDCCCICQTKALVQAKEINFTEKKGKTTSVTPTFYICGDICMKRLIARYHHERKYLINEADENLCYHKC